MLLLISFAVAIAQAPKPIRPAIPPPAGSTAPLRDTCANFWTLAPAETNKRKLMVLPAQEPGAQEPAAWIAPDIKGIATDNWQSLRLDDDGYVWLSKPGAAVYFDPRKTDEGAKAGDAAGIREMTVNAPWKLVAHMPASNHDLTAAVLGNRFYISGGLTAEWG
ncbi:MAG: hypothetical protein ACKV2V_24525, partial [Blastocatellia bacterium]